MKTVVCKSTCRPAFPYPNAATRRELIHKVLDHLLLVASCAGIAAALLLLFAFA